MARLRASRIEGQGELATTARPDDRSTCYGEQVFEIAVGLDGSRIGRKPTRYPTLCERFHRRHEELYTCAYPIRRRCWSMRASRSREMPRIIARQEPACPRRAECTSQRTADLPRRLDDRARL